jgi:hypothetical protein
MTFFGLIGFIEQSTQEFFTLEVNGTLAVIVYD